MNFSRSKVTKVEDKFNPKTFLPWQINLPSFNSVIINILNISRILSSNRVGQNLPMNKTLGALISPHHNNGINSQDSINTVAL
jgi:hypothetical protein